MHDSDKTPQSDTSSLADFEQRLRGLEPRSANFDIADQNPTDREPASIVQPIAKSSWSTIVASWSLGAAAGILGTLLSINLGLGSNGSAETADASEPGRIEAWKQPTPSNRDQPKQASEISIAQSHPSRPAPSFDIGGEPFSVLEILDRSPRLTPREASMHIATTAIQHRFHSVDLRAPIRAEKPPRTQSSIPNSATPDQATTLDLDPPPNRREMLRTMLDPFTST